MIEWVSERVLCVSCVYVVWRVCVCVVCGVFVCGGVQMLNLKQPNFYLSHPEYQTMIINMM